MASDIFTEGPDAAAPVVAFLEAFDRQRDKVNYAPMPSWKREFTMSIKSDKWIRRMSEQHGMIEPFEAGQVRENEKGRVISYGTSSYGYDVRCSNEFKIFTNVQRHRRPEKFR